MTSSDRINIKAGAKSQILDHFSFYLLLSILWLAFSWISNGINQQNITGVYRIIQGSAQLRVTPGAGTVALVLGIVGTMLHTGAQLTMIDIDRGIGEYISPVQKSFKLFEKSQYFIGWLVISILVFIFTFFWALLLVFPGVMKAYGYSQSFFIYRDAYDQGHPISALKAISQSQEMMAGNKGFLFLMDLSFLAWFILSGLFMNIPDLFVMPYYDMSRAKFYNQLIVRKATRAAEAMPDDDNTN